MNRKRRGASRSEAEYQRWLSRYEYKGPDLSIIKSLHLKNFKAYKDSGEIELAPVTLLFGPNSSGKSSFLQGLITLAQTERHMAINDQELSISGDLRSGTSFSNTLHKHDSEKELMIGFTKERIFNAALADSNLQSDENLKEMKGKEIQGYSSTSKGPKIELFYKNLFSTQDGSILIKLNLERDFYFSNDWDGLTEEEKLGYFSNLTLLKGVDRWESAKKSTKWEYKKTKLSWSRGAPNNDFNSPMEILDPDHPIPLPRGKYKDYFQVINQITEEGYHTFRRNELWWLDTDSYKKIDLIAKIVCEGTFKNIQEAEAIMPTKFLEDYEFKHFLEAVSSVTKVTPLARDGGGRNAWPTADFSYLPSEFYQPVISQKTADWINKDENFQQRMNLINEAVMDICNYFFPRWNPALGYDFKYISSYRDVHRSYDLHRTRHPDTDMAITLARSLPLRKEVSDWLKRLTKNTISIKTDGDQTITFEIKEDRWGLEINPAETGFGISQLIPILTTGCNTSNELICIEQPETHTHPALQAEMAEFFLETSLSPENPEGNKWLIETHSELLALRILKKIRKKEIKSDQVAFYYCSPDKEGSKIIHLRIDEDGNWLDEWPTGFFEESFNEDFS